MPGLAVPERARPTKNLTRVKNNTVKCYCWLGVFFFNFNFFKTDKQWCDWCDVRVTAQVTERECFYWHEECEIVCRSGFANVNIVFLICLMFIFERPIQITLFRIHLVSVIKCVTCQVRFWINYWRAWMDKQRQHSLRYLPDFTQQHLYFSSISVAWNVAYTN